MAARPFQFMVASRGAPDGHAIAEQARWAESVGFTHVAAHDHLAQRHAVTPLLSAVAMATERVGGRLVIGIGAGWNEPEYRAIGMQFDPPGIRISRMVEAIAILRGLFADDRFSYSGRFYTITDMDGGPKPVQKPHPPFLIGGTRERVLRLACGDAGVVVVSEAF